ncbi:MAG: hypothetical protein OXC40_01605 [Proteobacteria bacterium]|nr:hypothetical protein [Pseudomonadota bacterium]
MNLLENILGLLFVRELRTKYQPLFFAKAQGKLMAVPRLMGLSIVFLGLAMASCHQSSSNKQNNEIASSDERMMEPSYLQDQDAVVKAVVATFQKALESSKTQENGENSPIDDMKETTESNSHQEGESSQLAQDPDSSLDQLVVTLDSGSNHLSEGEDQAKLVTNEFEDEDLSQGSDICLTSLSVDKTFLLLEYLKTITVNGQQYRVVLSDKVFVQGKEAYLSATELDNQYQVHLSNDDLTLADLDDLVLTFSFESDDQSGDKVMAAEDLGPTLVKQVTVLAGDRQIYQLQGEDLDQTAFKDLTVGLTDVGASNLLMSSQVEVPLFKVQVSSTVENSDLNSDEVSLKAADSFASQKERLLSLCETDV